MAGSKCFEGFKVFNQETLSLNKYARRHQHVYLIALKCSASKMNGAYFHQEINQP